MIFGNKNQYIPPFLEFFPSFYYLYCTFCINDLVFFLYQRDVFYRTEIASIGPSLKIIFLELFVVVFSQKSKKNCVFPKCNLRIKMAVSRDLKKFLYE